MTIRCIDFETTGLPKEGERHGIMEYGACDLAEDGMIAAPFGELVDCGIPTTIEARAVHHISDKDVAGAIGPTDACMKLMADKPSYFCAHNVDMEKAFFGGGEVPWLCTYKSALRVYPEAPGHKLQELRYWLDVDSEPDFDPALAGRPHRAPDDAYVCAFVLRNLMQKAPVADMARWSKGPALLFMCFMKKHKGKPWSQVGQDDPEYLDWLYNKSDVTDRDIRATAKFYLNQAIQSGRYNPKNW